MVDGAYQGRCYTAGRRPPITVSTLDDGATSRYTKRRVVMPWGRVDGIVYPLGAFVFLLVVISWFVIGWGGFLWDILPSVPAGILIASIFIMTPILAGALSTSIGLRARDVPRYIVILRGHAKRRPRFSLSMPSSVCSRVWLAELPEE